MSDNQYQKAAQSQFFGQWITSLAISVVCCAVLFVLFAGYMVHLQDRTSAAEIRIELMQEKYTQLVSEMQSIRRMPPSTVFNMQGVAPVGGALPVPSSVSVPEAPAVIQNGYGTPPPADKVDLGVPAYESSESGAPLVR